MNAFFDNLDTGQFAMTPTGPAALTATETAFSEKVDKWSGLLREVILFGPGTFILYFFSMAFAAFLPDTAASLYSWAMLVSAAFLTYAGAGNLKQVRNLAVPGIVIVWGMAVVLYSNFYDGDVIYLYLWDSMYIFPFVLISAKLVQSWMATKS